jgi:hypothetical protein
MSSIKPINIIFDNKQDNTDLIECIFTLTIQFKDGSTKIFRELCYSKCCVLFTKNEMINYNMINKYTIKITILKFIKDFFIATNNINTNEDTHIFKNDEIYIEFSQNIDGYTNCCCNLIALDNKRMFITPPNY